MDNIIEDHILSQTDKDRKDEIFCSICMNIIKDAHEHKCGTLFCKLCINPILYSTNKCPICRENLSGNIHPSAKADRYISNVKVICYHADCKKELRIGDLSKHLTTECKYEKYDCKECTTSVLYIEKKQHDQDICMGRIVTCALCNNKHKLNLTEKHQETCPEYTRPCGKCKESIKNKDLQSHLTHNCMYSIKNCDNACGYWAMRKLFDPSHHNNCGYRFIQCEYCQSQFRAIGIQEHKQSKCDHRPNKCTKCNLEFKYKDESYHQVYVCEYRPMSCTLCSEKIAARELDTHKKEKCPNREVKCPHCKETHKGWQHKNHIDNTCPEVMMTCADCKVELKRGKYYDHCNNTCPERQVMCPHYDWTGCDKTVKRKDIESHRQNLEYHTALAKDYVKKIKADRDSAYASASRSNYSGHSVHISNPIYEYITEDMRTDSFGRQHIQIYDRDDCCKLCRTRRPESDYLHYTNDPMW
jgi:hypothetical protein